MTAPLFQPLHLANRAVIPNRFLKSATSEQLGDRARNPTRELIRLYETWSQGGAGLIVCGNLMVDRTALGEPWNVALDENSDLDLFRQWAAAGTTNGNHFWAQLNHPGKQSPKYLSKEPVAPSAVPLGAKLAGGFNCPRALTEAEIKGIIDAFATAARLAREVGFTGVQIHGAHGYLVNQFMSPRHNIRQDQWGGSLENRMRFAVEVYKAIRAAVGEDFPIGIKLNSADYQKGGFTEGDSMQVVDHLVAAGIDHIEISGGNYESPAMMSGRGAAASTIARESFFLDYAERLRARTDVPLCVTGGFTSGPGMSEAVESGATDMVGLARAIILEPDLPNRIEADATYAAPYQMPSTGNRKVDAALGVGLVWFEAQLWRIGKGRKPSKSLSAWGVAFKSFWAVLTGPKAGLRE